MEYDELNESTEESTEEFSEESNEESAEESSEESNEESTEELTEESIERIDYDKLEQIVSENSYVPASYDTELNDLPITDVLLLVVALILGILCVKGRK